MSTAVVWMLVAFLRRLRQFFKKEPDSFWRWCGFCIYAGYLGFLLHGLTVDMLFFRHLWIMLGIGTAMAQMAKLPPRMETRS